MKVCIIQPYYSFDAKDTQSCYDRMVEMLDECDDSLDLIVLPEYSDVPSQQENGVNGYYDAFMRYNADIKAREGEIAEVEWIPLEQAEVCLAHENDKTVFRAAMERMQRMRVDIK